MITVESAIKILRTECIGDSEYMELAKQMGANALAKQIPKKPRIIVHKYMYHEEEISANFTHCPCCFDDIQLGYLDTLVDKDTPYCRRCGQALDWSDTYDRPT